MFIVPGNYAGGRSDNYLMAVDVEIQKVKGFITVKRHIVNTSKVNLLWSNPNKLSSSIFLPLPLHTFL